MANNQAPNHRQATGVSPPEQREIWRVLEASVDRTLALSLVSTFRNTAQCVDPTAEPVLAYLKQAFDLATQRAREHAPVLPIEHQVWFNLIDYRWFYVDGLDKVLELAPVPRLIDAEPTPMFSIQRENLSVYRQRTAATLRQLEGEQAARLGPQAGSGRTPSAPPPAPADETAPPPPTPDQSHSTPAPGRPQTPATAAL